MKCAEIAWMTLTEDDESIEHGKAALDAPDGIETLEELVEWFNVCWCDNEDEKAFIYECPGLEEEETYEED